MPLESIQRSRYASPPVECEHSSQNHSTNRESRIPSLNLELVYQGKQRSQGV